MKVSFIKPCLFLGNNDSVVVISFILCEYILFLKLLSSDVVNGLMLPMFHNEIHSVIIKMSSRIKVVRAPCEFNVKQP